MGAPAAQAPPEALELVWPPGTASDAEARLGLLPPPPAPCRDPGGHTEPPRPHLPQQWMERLQSCVWSRGDLCILCAALVFALSALFVKLTAGRVPVLQITLVRSGLSFVVSVGLIKARGVVPMFGHRASVRWLIPRGIFGAVAMSTYYGSLLLLPLADATAIFFSNPALTAVAAWLLRGESLELLGAAGCACSLLGMLVLTHPPGLFGGHEDWGPRRMLGVALGAFSACCAAGAFISIRFIGKSEPSLVVALYFHTCTLLLSALPLALGWPQRAAPMGLADSGCLLGVAATSFLGQLLLTRGFQLESAAKGACLNFSQVVYAFILGVAFFQEQLRLSGVLGTLLIAAGIVAVSTRSSSSSQQAAASSKAVGAPAGDPAGAAAARGDGGGPGFVARLASFQRLLQSQRPADEARPASAAEADELLRVEQELSWQPPDGGLAAQRGAGQEQLVPAAAGPAGRASGPGAALPLLWAGR